MYAVSPSAEAAWRELLARVADDAGVPLAYLPWPAPKPLEELWRRDDLGAVFMCGFPLALGIAPNAPLAAPIPAASWAGGKAVYRTDFIVRAESRFRTLTETFSGTFGWTVAHSHSGFNAPRHHLLAYRAGRDRVYAHSRGNLVTARNVLDAVIDGSIDCGPLDAYWHALLARHAPELVARVRVIESSELAPIPAFVTSSTLPDRARDRLRSAFLGAATRPWFAGPREDLALTGFALAESADYAITLARDSEARAAGYFLPE
jgi:ABC-type phosphate/phosphonate transport system substrate-binding protein